MSLPYAYYAATLCKKPEQTYERILRSSSEGRTDERTDERTDGRTDKSEFVGPNSAPRGTKNAQKVNFENFPRIKNAAFFKRPKNMFLWRK